jgi:hypothetical protein
MNTQKSVFKKISKIEHPQQVELSEVQKVELSSIKEMDRLSQDVKEVTSFWENRLQDFERVKQDLKQSIKGRTQQSIDLTTAISEATKKAEDLGVDIDTSKYERILDEYYKMVDKVDAALR